MYPKAGAQPLSVAALFIHLPPCSSSTRLPPSSRSPKLAEGQLNYTKLLPFHSLSPYPFATGENFTNIAKIQISGVEATAKKNVDNSLA